MRHIREIALLIGVLANPRVVLGVDEFSLETDFAASMFTQPDAADAPSASSAQASPAPIPKFGEKNSWRWMVQAGIAFDIDQNNHFVLTGGGVSYFIVDNLSLNLELNAMYFSQTGPDAVGVNFALLFRWHFLSGEKWSFYADGGAGLLAATDKVPGPTPDEPRGGSSINFTPQGGFGFTVEVVENVRFFGGARIYHISNAQMYEGNPGRDSILIYGGVSFPF